MNKQEAKDKLAELEQKAAELKAIIEAPEGNGSGVINPTGKYWHIKNINIGGAYNNRGAVEKGVDNMRTSLAFATKEDAEAFQDVIQVMLEFRLQKGWEAWRSGALQAGLSLDPECSIIPIGYSSHYSSAIAGRFDTTENLEAAIDSIGEERVDKALKWLAGVK